MSAEAIAGELGLDLYAIDLATVVSKYIGETEKNLGRVFDAAEQANVILLFDEAEALFGKRSEVKDAHDRYANVEIGYLLQRMEAYPGTTILATNLRHHLDEAFLRRLQAVVEFPMPAEADRLRLWRKMFPSEAPLARDVDFGALAREVRLAGGNIRNIALAGAFAAAAEGRPIGIADLWLAAGREHRKLGRPWHREGAAA
jgi:SpoVK/Ycf46/Vps4 family AAA+-type ATPase